jgi:hypothetical protein
VSPAIEAKGEQVALGLTSIHYFSENSTAQRDERYVLIRTMRPWEINHTLLKEHAEPQSVVQHRS